MANTDHEAAAGSEPDSPVEPEWGTGRGPAHGAATEHAAASVPAAELDVDVLVVGSGVAGLTTAAEAARLGLRVAVVTKARLGDGNTRWAQGGVAVVRPDECDSHDSIARHVADTLEAGAGLCDAHAVRTILADGPAAVQRLQHAGAVFDRGKDGRLARTREGGHSTYRIIRAGGDATGEELQRVVQQDIRGPRVLVLEQRYVARLLHSTTGAVVGAELIDGQQKRTHVRTPAVLLATGGLGQLYHTTSNPGLATADGIALALRAGAEVADLEFVQFHPTVLYAGAGSAGRRPLVTEAVRGEGARLVDATGASVMAGVHPRADLAPRDVVSAAITRRMASAPAGVADHVFLDATCFTAAVWKRRFPTVWAACAEVGVDPAREPIPVAPAAHFACGGVVATVDGRTSVSGLYAAGEVARSGLHGGNRLASNSLLEGLVVGRRCAQAIAADLPSLTPPGPVADGGDFVPGVPDRAHLQHLMSRYAAIGRDHDGLARLATALHSVPRRRPVGWTDHENGALWLTARVLTMLAAAREESRGCHVRSDWPERNDGRWRRSLGVRMDVADSAGSLRFIELAAVGDAA